MHCHKHIVLFRIIKKAPECNRKCNLAFSLSSNHCTKRYTCPGTMFWDADVDLRILPAFLKLNDGAI